MISVWCETSVNDFGRYFSTQGVAADNMVLVVLAVVVAADAMVAVSSAWIWSWRAIASSRGGTSSLPAIFATYIGADRT